MIIIHEKADTETLKARECLLAWDVNRNGAFVFLALRHLHCAEQLWNNAEREKFKMEFVAAYNCKPSAQEIRSWQPRPQRREWQVLRRWVTRIIVRMSEKALDANTPQEFEKAFEIGQKLGGSRKAKHVNAYWARKSAVDSYVFQRALYGRAKNGEKPDIDRIAGDLGLSKKTIYRYLNEEGVQVKKEKK